MEIRVAYSILCASILEEHIVHILSTEDGISILLRNVGTWPNYYTAQQTRKSLLVI